MSLNQELSDLFANLSALMELNGENVFKVIAFQKVSRILRDSNIDLKKCIEEGRLCDVEGIGKGSQQIIEEYVQTGRSSVYEEATSAVPKGLVELMHIEGLGPKTIHLLWHERQITSLSELEKAIAAGGLKGVKGLGEKKIATIQQGIAAYKNRLAPDGTVRLRTGIADAQEYATPLLEEVRGLKGVIRAELAGSLRRRKETIADIDIVAAIENSAKGESIGQAFANLSGVIQTIVTGASKTSVKLANGMQADLRLVPDENFGAALLYFTGSKEHNVKIRSLALKKKMTLNEWGLYKLDEYEKAKKETAKPPALAAGASGAISRTEEEIYRALGLDFIPPELREDRGEVEAAKEKRLPVLITRKDIKGDLHTHTTASDGKNSIEEMAEAAKALGYEYLAITDHSKALAMANGLSVERLMKQIEAIHKASDRIKGITLLAGTECDILADGRLDYEDEVLKELDIVVASPHVSLKQDEKKSTDRLLRAIENKYVNIIGHPTGRLINGRAGLPLNLPRIYEAAARSGTAMEINAGYPRLDLNDVNARAASEAGCTIAIDTDTHTVIFDEIEWGIDVARRAGLTPAKVLNCQPLAPVRKFIKAKRDR
jgi:DNA polymerase (family 10)